MAYLGRVGNVVRQTTTKQIASESAFSRPSIYQALRCMSSSTLFVGAISYGTDETSLKEAFSKYGKVAYARVIVDRDSGRSRGFGFVSYSTAEEASSAIQAMDGQELHGRKIVVDFARDRAPPGGDFGGGGSGGVGGGYGGGYNNNYGGGGYNSSYGGGGNSYDRGRRGGFGN